MAKIIWGQPYCQEKTASIVTNWINCSTTTSTTNTRVLHPYRKMLVSTTSVYNSYDTEWKTLSNTYRVDFDGEEWVVAEPTSPREKLREIIAKRSAPAIICKRRSLTNPQDICEERARQTLRRIISDDEYRMYLSRGFVSVRGKSGKWYQVFPGYDFTNVWANGKVVERLCVVLNGNFPPTDALIARILLILNDEDTLWAKANKHGPLKVNIPAVLPFKLDASLPEILAELKKQKHNLWAA